MVLQADESWPGPVGNGGGADHGPGVVEQLVTVENVEGSG